MTPGFRDRVIDIVLGGLLGLVGAAVLAVNLVIFSGAERGYETSIPDLFDESPVVAVVVVVLLVAGPVAGATIAHRMRQRRTSTRIGEAKDADIPAIVGFFREAWAMTGPDAPGWAGASDDVIDQLTDPDLIRSRIGGPARRMFLAWDGTRLVGFAATRFDDTGAAELAGIVVLADMVGRGIGTPLLEAALGGLQADGASSVVVRTEADNERAIRFYRSRGFGDEHRVIEDVEGTPTELVELSRRL